jgi:hypothetical protein
MIIMSPGRRVGTTKSATDRDVFEIFSQLGQSEVETSGAGGQNRY